MTRSQIEIAVAMDGLAIHAMQRALATTILIERLGLFAPSMSIEMSLVQQSPTSCPILRIRFDSQLRQESPELPMSSLRAESHRLAWAGAGASIREAILITIIAISLSLKRAITILHFFKSHY